MRTRTLTIVATLLIASQSATAWAQSASERAALEGQRWSVHVGGGGWVDPLSDATGYPGAVVHGGRSLWLGPAWGGVFQFSAHLEGALGVSAQGVHVFAAPTFGFEFGSLSLLSIETQVGFGPGGFAGADGAAVTAGVYGAGGWALRPFADTSHKFMLGLLMLGQFTIAPTPPSTDCPLCPSFMATLGYERTY